MNSAAGAAVIEEYSRELKVPAILREHLPLARQAADGEWPYEEFLSHLLEAEVKARRDGAADRCLREAASLTRRRLNRSTGRP